MDTSFNESEVQFDREKFLDVLHFICHLSDSDSIGRTKLHKILYFSDMIKFIDTGIPLTGVEYIKQKFGPTARHLNWGLQKLNNAGSIEASEQEYFGYRKLYIRSKVEPNTSNLSKKEISIIEDVVEFVCAQSAKAISEFSHNAAWEAAELGEIIPYYSAYGLLPVEIEQADIDWASEEAHKIFG